jgi:hypothetical protein
MTVLKPSPGYDVKILNIKSLRQSQTRSHSAAWYGANDQVLLICELNYESEYDYKIFY